MSNFNIKFAAVLKPIRLGMVMLLAMCGTATFATPLPQTPEQHVIQVGIDLWPGYYPIVIADQLGYFEKKGIKVNFVLPEDTDSMLDDFVAGKLDAVCVAMGDAFALYERDKDLRVVLITDESAGGDALVAKQIDVTSKKNLVIGTNLNGFGELFVDEFIRQNGLDRNKITLIHQEASQALEFLQSGRADIVHTWEPYVTDTISYAGGRVIFDSSRTPGLIRDSLLFNGSFINKHSREGRALIEAWLEAAEWWLQHRREGDVLVEKRLLQMPGTVNLEGIELYTKKKNLEAFRPNVAPTSLYKVTQKYIDFFRKKGVLKTDLKPDDILDNHFLPR